MPTDMSMRIGPVLLLGSLAALGGCVQGPDYERPGVAVPDDFRFQDATASFEADTEVWWQAFDDPTLERVSPTNGALPGSLVRWRLACAP